MAAAGHAYGMARAAPGVIVLGVNNLESLTISIVLSGEIYKFTTVT